MSHAGPPSEPPEDPSQGGGTDPYGQPPSGEPSGEQPYNPYPDNWNAPDQGQPSPYAPPDPYQQASPYGEPNPYGQAAPYGQPSPYAAPGQPGQHAGSANPYAGPTTTRPTFGFGGYASWLTRVGAYLIDSLCFTATLIPLFIGLSVLGANSTTTVNPDGTQTTEYSGSTALPISLIVISLVAYVAFYIWNICIRQGRTGATIGKSVLAVRLVNPDLQPIGPGWAFLRNLLHVVDSILCGLGYLWPIWDSRRQTFSDKIMNTFVIHATTPVPPAYPPQSYPPQSS